MSIFSIFLLIFTFFPGYFLLKCLWRHEEKSLTPLEGIVLSIGLSFLLSYPFGVLNNAWENADPFQFHLDSFFIISCLSTLFLYWISKKYPTPFNWIDLKQQCFAKPNSTFFFIGLFFLAFCARGYGLSLQGINGDEQELSLYAYHLVDGIFAGREALFISTSGHGPLGFTVSFLIYQWLAPYGYETLSEALLRSPMLIFGLLELLIFILFAQRLKFSKQVTLLGLLLLAIHPFMIFGSRLMIPQDGSIFAFFLLLFLYFFWTFLEKPALGTRSRRIILALLFSSLLLVKLSGILLVPLILFYSLFKKRPIKEFALCGAWSLLFFSPVILFNIAAYIKTGYMDVPFSKIANLFGIPALSIMSGPSSTGLYSAELPNFLENSLTFFGLLIDQWGFVFFISFSLSLILLFLKKSLKHSAYEAFHILMLGLFLTSLAFFTLNGSRAYYLEFLTLPATLVIILTGSQLKSSKILLVSLYLVVLFSIGALSFTTHWQVRDPTSTLLNTPKEYGRESYTWKELQAPLSLSSWIFLNDDGFQALQNTLETTATEKSVLVIEDALFKESLHQFRWYLGLHRDVEAHYLKDEYTEPYEYFLLSEFFYDRPAIFILSYPPEEAVACEGDLIRNHNDIPKFLICESTRP